MSARQIQLGVFLSGQHPAGASAVAAVRDHVEQVELARELGLSSVWAGQHFLSHPFQMFQSVPLLARIAAAADGMTVGTAILLLTLLNPVEVAENAATLAAIAGGRFVLGVGFGYRATENTAFGVARGRADLFERKLDVVRRLLAGESVTASGEGFELADARLALVPDRPPPIWVAANSDRAVRRAARVGDAWFVNPHTRLDELERQMHLFRDEREAGGRPAAASTPVLKEVCVAATDEEALEIARRGYRQWRASFFKLWHQHGRLPSPAAMFPPEFDEAEAAGRAVAGAPAKVRDVLRAVVAESGSNYLLCRFAFGDITRDEAQHSVDLFAREVMPAFP